jgi:predicted N-acyltransferase
VQGARLLARDEASREALLEAALRYARVSGRSSLHILFPTPAEACLMAQQGMLMRHGVQFHWCNEGYRDFEAFLGALTSKKRKKIRQERRRVSDQGVRFRHLVGDDIDARQWRFFSRCYRLTYAAHHAAPYLNLGFFEHLGRTMPVHLLLVLAERDGEPLASALNVFTDETLYGRYWGALDYVPSLHFETCYYQAIEFCIERGIRYFEGGAQGEHKLARGLLPVRTVSAHWLAHPEFARAIERYLAQESLGVESYVDELNEHAPFRNADPELT